MALSGASRRRQIPSRHRHLEADEELAVEGQRLRDENRHRLEAGLGHIRVVDGDAVHASGGGDPAFGSQARAVLHRDAGVGVRLSTIAPLEGEDELFRIAIVEGWREAFVVAGIGGVAAEHPLERGGVAAVVKVECGVGIAEAGEGGEPGGVGIGDHGRIRREELRRQAQNVGEAGV